MSELNGKAKLFAKITKVMSAVRTLPKDGTNTFDNYKYTTGDAAFERIGRAMAEAGVAALPSIVEVTTETGQSSSGKVQLRTVIHGQITLGDNETGETWTSDWYGEGADRGDKSINKAVTAMMKYYLLRLFMVGSGEDPDEESPEVTTPQTPKKAPVQPQKVVAPQHRPAPATNGKAASVDQGDKSPAFKRLMAEGTKTFNGTWEDARHWLINRYSRKMTPKNIRTSANDLSDDECTVLADALVEQRSYYQDEWKKSQQVPA